MGRGVAVLACQDGRWHTCGRDFQFPAGGMWASAREAAGFTVVGQRRVGARPAVVRVVGCPPHVLADPVSATAGAEWPACSSEVGGTLCRTALAALIVAAGAAPTPGERGSGKVVCLSVGWVGPDKVPGRIGFGEPGVACGKDDFGRRPCVLGVARDPGGAVVGLD